LGENSILKLKRKQTSQGNCCPNPDCGKTFSEPITATNLSAKSKETYYACPFCLSRIDEDELASETVEENTTDVKNKLSTVVEKEEKQEKRPTLKIEVPKEIKIPKPTCPYSFGYLKKRPKNTSIPEECMLCPDMMKCLL